MQTASKSAHLGGESVPRPRFDLVSRTAKLADAYDERELLDALARLATPSYASSTITTTLSGRYSLMRPQRRRCSRSFLRFGRPT